MACSSWPTSLALRSSRSLYLHKLTHFSIHNKSPFSRRKLFQKQHKESVLTGSTLNRTSRDPFPPAWFPDCTKAKKQRIQERNFTLTSTPAGGAPPWLLRPKPTGNNSRAAPG